MKVKKFLVSVMCVAMLGAMGSMSVHAAAIDIPSPIVVESTEEIEPRADIIEIKYRVTPDNKLQYRRWNSTRGYWVDPYWIDI